MNYSLFFDMIHVELRTIEDEMERLVESGQEVPCELEDAGSALFVLGEYVGKKLDPAELSIKLAALLYGKTVDEITRDIQETIAVARADSDPDEAALWDAMFPDGDPEPVDFLRAIAELKMQLDELEQEGENAP